MRERIRVIALAFVAFLVATSSHGAEIGRWSGQYSTPTEPRAIVATTADDWQSLRALTGGDALAAKPFDAVHQTGIGVFLGRRNSGGYGVKILSMTAHDGKFVIEIDEQKPAAGQMTTQSLTSPWLVLLIDRPDLPVSIEPRFHTN